MESRADFDIFLEKQMTGMVLDTAPAANGVRCMHLAFDQFSFSFWKRV